MKVNIKIEMIPMGAAEMKAGQEQEQEEDRQTDETWTI